MALTTTILLDLTLGCAFVWWFFWCLRALVSRHEKSPPTSLPSPSLVKEARKTSEGENITAEVFAQWCPSHHPIVRGIRLSSIRNPETGRRLEFDIYCPTLKLALEYDGAQHHHFVPKWHRSPDAFASQQRRDRYKSEAAAREGITLIRVPHWVDAGARSRDERKERIARFLIPLLNEALR